MIPQIHHVLGSRKKFDYSFEDRRVDKLRIR